MPKKHSNFKILLQDLKISYKFAWKNIISFILGTIGVIIVSGLLMILLAIMIIPITIFAIGLEDFTLFFANLTSGFSNVDGAAVVGLVTAFIMPFVAPMMIAVGALFGMGREIVESEGTTAQGVFAWYKSKFTQLAGGGIIMFLLAVLPIGIIFIFTGPLVFMSSSPLVISLLAAGGALYLTIVLGSLSMVFPAIIDGFSVVGAIKESLSMSRTYFDRVYSVWLSFIGIPFLLMMPFTLIPVAVSLGTPTILALSLFGLVTMIFIIFIHFPATVIGLSRVYMVLSGVEGPSTEKTQPEIQLVGDV